MIHYKLTHDETKTRFDLIPGDGDWKDLLDLAGDYLKSVPLERLDWEAGMLALGWIDAEFDFLRQDPWTAYFKHRETGLEIDVAIANIPTRLLPTPCVYVEMVGEADVTVYTRANVIANRSDAWNLIYRWDAFLTQENPDELVKDLEIASWDAKRSFLHLG